MKFIFTVKTIYLKCLYPWGRNVKIIYKMEDCRLSQKFTKQDVFLFDDNSR